MVHAIKIIALWKEPNVGLHGYIGAVLADGTEVALCSVEKWEQGPFDSLRYGWVDNICLFPHGKIMYSETPESVLRQDGLLGGTLLAMSGMPNRPKITVTMKYAEFGKGWYKVSDDWVDATDLQILASVRQDYPEAKEIRITREYQPVQKGCVV